MASKISCAMTPLLPLAYWKRRKAREHVCEIERKGKRVSSHRYSISSVASAGLAKPN